MSGSSSATSTRGRNDEARLHWEQALRLEPEMGVVANNLAWVLAHDEPPDLTRALELAERAVQSKPSDSRFRGTRGVVLMKLGRSSEAITDLEAELAGNPNRSSTHLALAAAMCLLLFVHDRGDLWLLYTVTVLYGLGGDVFGAARTSMLKAMLPDEPAQICAGSVSLRPPAAWSFFHRGVHAVCVRLAGASRRAAAPP